MKYAGGLSIVRKTRTFILMYKCGQRHTHSSTDPVKRNSCQDLAWRVTPCNFFTPSCYPFPSKYSVGTIPDRIFGGTEVPNCTGNPEVPNCTGNPEVQNCTKQSGQPLCFVQWNNQYRREHFVVDAAAFRSFPFFPLVHCLPKASKIR